MRYKNITLFCLLFIYSIQIKAQTVDIEKNIISQQSHLNNFYKKLDDTTASIKILHLGDSHIMIGHFANEIRRLLDSSYGVKSYGWVFPNQIGKYNTFYTNSKVLKGKVSFANNLHKEAIYQNGIAGQSVQILDDNTEIEFSLKNIPKKFLYFNKLKLLYQSDSSTNFSISVLDTIEKQKNIFDSISYERSETKRLLYNEKISQFKFNNSYNKFKLRIEKKDSTHLFNLLGIYLENTNHVKDRLMYSSLGVGGSSLYSITNNNSLLINDVNNYEPDLIILSFGSNDAYNKTFDTLKYKNKLESLIDSLLSKNSKLSILLTAPPDSRSKNREPVSIEQIQEVFAKISEKYNNVAYWDLRSIMGGKNSVLNWLKYKLAATDKLHYTKEGYILQAQLLIEALLKY
jgi:lysophospholipase L1-like esterase